MKRTTRLISLLFLFLTLALSLLFAADQGTGRTAHAASAATGEIVLIARDIADLKWDPTNYPGSSLQFVRWELFRGLSAGSLTKITSGQSQFTDHYRDTGLAPGTTYYYRLDVVRCQAPCDPSDETNYPFFTDSAKAGVFQGKVHYPLGLSSGVYSIGFGDVGSSASVSVVDGATLQIGYGTTVQPAAGVSSGGLNANGGRLEIAGATFKDVSISFGDYYDESSAGQGWVKSSLMIEGSTIVSVVLYGTSDVTVEENSGPFNIVAEQQSTLTARNNVMTGGISVIRQAKAVIRGNQITNGNVEVDGYGAQGDPKATAQISENTVNLDYKNMGIRVYDGATANVHDNQIAYLGSITSESTVLISVADDDTTLTAERNKISNGKIAAFWGPAINLADNVVTGDGSAISIGCPFCGTGVQATGSIERNTVQSGWGLEMWAGSQSLTIRHNCIRGNDPGLTTDDAFMTEPLNVQYNWWGHTSGPRHASNPGGSGDVIDGNKVVFNPWDQVGTYCRDSPPLPEKPDLRVEQVLMVQVVEGLSSLVEAKPLAVKAVVSSDILLDQEVKVSLNYAGVEMAQFYILEDSNLNSYGQLQEPSGSLSFDKIKQQTIVFFPEQAPFGTSAVAEVKIDPTGEMEESNESNNSKTVSQPVVKTFWGSDPGDQSLSILFNYSSAHYKGGITSVFRAAVDGQGLSMIMPLAKIDYLSDVGLDKGPDSDCPPKKPPDIFANEKYRELKAANPSFQYFVLAANRNWWSTYYCKDSVLPSDEGISYWLPESVPGLIVSNVSNTKMMLQATLRRLGAPVSKQYISVNGGWIVEERRFLDDAFAQRVYKTKVRSLLGAFSPYGVIWIDAAGYKSLLQSHQTAALFSGRNTTADDLVLVSGTITNDDQVNLDPIYRLPAGLSSRLSAGPYTIKFLDNGDNVLFTYPFDVAFSYETDEGPVTGDIAAFSFALPHFAAAAKIVVEKAGLPLETLVFSANAPSVQVTYPNGGENFSGQKTVTWTAGDVDGNDLFYTVLYSPDNGATWETLAMDLAVTSFNWDTGQVPGSQSQGLIKVIASDGYHTAEDSSDNPFSLANKAPSAGILRPIDEAVVTQGTPAVLEGVAFDLEEGWLDGSALSWHSSKDGDLGAGSVVTVALTSGQHLVQATATDGSDSTGTAQITVTVGSETRPDLSLAAGDVSHPLMEVPLPGWLAAEVRNVVADVTATASFYDGNPAAGGRLIGQVEFDAPANSMQTVAVDWIPASAGLHTIYVLLSDANPLESNTGNNQAIITVQVKESKAQLYLPAILKRHS